jgi:E3 SUMO-protein ligase NSE2
MSSRRTLLSNNPGGGRAVASSSSSSSRHRSQPSSRHQREPGSSAPHLPAYEPPSCALDAEGRRALADLGANATLARAYEDQLAKARKLLGDSVAELNDRIVERRARLASRREKLGGGGGGDDGEDAGEGGGGGRKRPKRTDADVALEAAVNRLDDVVPAASRRCDEAVRDVIDWGVELADGRVALREAADETEAESARLEQQLEEARAAAEARRGGGGRKRRRMGGAEEDEENEEEDDDEDAADEDVKPTMAADLDVEITGPRRLLEQSRDRLAADYAAKTAHARYGLNNEYVAFKRVWHDAKHGRDGRPLPDASRWFTASGQAADVDDHQDHANGGRRRQGRRSAAEEEEEDEDEDLIVAGEVMDIRCPLTRAVMQQPYTSETCRHTFEKAAIIEFLRSQPGRKARCPQTGCDKVSKNLALQPLLPPTQRPHLFRFICHGEMNKACERGYLCYYGCKTNIPFHNPTTSRQIG